MKEVELAQKFVDYLSCFDLYFEVDYGSGCVDIVAFDGNISIAVEVKTTFSFKVFEQALANKPWYNYTYIAVPKFKDDYIQRRLCNDYGIGLLIYDTSGYCSVMEVIKPKLNRVKSDKLRSRLREQNKRSLPGSKNGDSTKVTAFQITVENLVRYVERNPGKTLRQAIDDLSHHYSTNKAATSSLYQHIKSGVIKEIEIQDGKLFKKLANETI